MNNPLGGLLNATDTIRSYADRPEVVRSSAELLDRGLRHLRDVSRVILEENRLDRSGRSLSSADFEDLRLLFEPEVQRRGQGLGWDIAADDPALRGVPSAPVRQIALNLLLNASSAAGQAGQVGFRVCDGDGQVQLEITDDGPGLPGAACRGFCPRRRSRRGAASACGWCATLWRTWTAPSPMNGPGGAPGSSFACPCARGASHADRALYRVDRG